MSLEDRTNENIPLSMYDGEPISVDVDSDSSFTPSMWVHIYGNPADQDFGFSMTFEEATLLRDRLNLILGE
jgi:hypothetical protein